MPLTLSGDGSIGPLSATEVSYLDGVTSAVQTQINGKIASGAAGMTLITNGTLSGASVLLNNIPGTYKDLRLVIRNYKPETDNIGIQVRINQDSTANRYRVVTSPFSAQTTFASTMWNPGYGNDNSQANGLMVWMFFDYANASTWKFAQFSSLTNNSTTATNPDWDWCYGLYNQTAAVTAITVFPSSGNFTSGDYLLYGVN